MSDRRLKWVKLSLAFLVALLVAVPAGAWGLMRANIIVPVEASMRLGPVRLATTCYSRKRLCYALENSNPPPEELLVLIDWPGGPRREEVLFTVPIR